MTPTIPTLAFVFRGLVPLGMATFGEFVFVQQGWPLYNGLWLVGAAGACLGWALEHNLSDQSRRRLLNDIEALTGADISDEQRAAIETIRRSIEDLDRAQP